MSKRIESLLICLTILTFVLVYSILVVSKHNHFQTSAFDLGIYDQVMWRYATFQSPYSTLKHGLILGDHFTPILLLFVPFYWLWSDPRTLLIIQVLLVCLSAWPLYKIAKRLWGVSSKFSFLSYWLLVITYLIYIGIQNALDFDFHLATITVFPLSILFYAMIFKKWRLYWLFLVLALLTKEDVPLVIIMLGLYQMTILGKRRLGAATALIAAGYFYLIAFKIMPLFSSQIAGGYINFGNLGSTPGEIATTALRDPITALREFFNPDIKRDTLLVMLKSFSFLPLLSGFFYLVSLPFLAERFLSTAPLRWKLGFHYSVNIAPILALGAVHGISNLFKLYPKGKAAIPLTLTILMFSLSLGINNQYRPLIYKVFARETFKMDQGSRDAIKILSLIPENASISAQSPFVPHLSQRDDIYLYPDKRDEVEYIMLSLDKSTYPLYWHEMVEEVRALKEREGWVLVAYENKTFLFRKDSNKE